MSKKKEKCPACGLVNFRDAAECQWCALALSGRARTELIDDLPRSGAKPWGLLLMLLAVAIIGGGVFRFVTRKAVERAEPAAEATESAKAAKPSAAPDAAKTAKQAKRTGPPKLSGRSPSDPQPPQEIDFIQQSIEMNRKNAGRHRDWRRETQEYMQQKEPRDMFGRRLLPNNDVAPLPLPGDKQSPPPAPDDPEER